MSVIALISFHYWLSMSSTLLCLKSIISFYHSRCHFSRRSFKPSTIDAFLPLPIFLPYDCHHAAVNINIDHISILNAHGPFSTAVLPKHESLGYDHQDSVCQASPRDDGNEDGQDNKEKDNNEHAVEYFFIQNVSRCTKKVVKLMNK